MVQHHPDLPAPLPPYLHPATGQPLAPQDLAPIFPMELIEQEVSQERWIPIPDEVQRIYRLWRPTPAAPGPAPGSRPSRPRPASTTRTRASAPPAATSPTPPWPRPTTTRRTGIKRLATETGAGQWGSALAFACNLFGLECTVYMVKVSYHQKPYRRSLMHIWGGEVYPIPHRHAPTRAGTILADDPDTSGSLGIAICEAVEDAATHDGHQLLPGQRAQPRDAAPDRHRPGDQKAAGAGRGGAGRAHRLRRRRQQLRRASASRSCRTSSRARRSASSRWSRRPAPP